MAALCSSPHLAVSYSGICEAISKHWELPQVWLQPQLSSQTTMALEKKEDDFMLPYLKDGNQVFDKVELENCASVVGECNLTSVSGSGTEKCFLTPGSRDVSLADSIQNDLAVTRVNGATMDEILTIKSAKLSENGELSCLAQQGLAEESSVTGISACTPGYKSFSVGQKNGICLSATFCMNRKVDSNEAGGRAVQQRNNSCVYMGSIYKPYTYINHYVHGDFAASAAANFAVLSSDENRSSEAHASDPRKAMSANIMLQTKAFSSAAARFFWPSTEKKLIEAPRERCSWCFHCKSPVISRKGCLLNQAASNATRAAMKFCSGQKLVKNVEGGLYGIAAYTLYMEESLRGLIVGPFHSASYQKQWRKKVEQVSTCSEMKCLLLEVSFLLYICVINCVINY